jgi:hypothetical protein
VHWSVFEGIDGEEIRLKSEGAPKARIIAIPAGAKRKPALACSVCLLRAQMRRENDEEAGRLGLCCVYHRSLSHGRQKSLGSGLATMGGPNRDGTAPFSEPKI